MVNTLQQAFFSGTATAAATLQYWDNTGGKLLNRATNESQAQTIIRSAGTASNLYVNVTANTSASAVNVTFRKNATNGNLVAVVTASFAGFYEDTTHSDALSSGDLVNCSYGATTASTTQTVTTIGYLFAATTNTVTRLVDGGSSSLAGNFPLLAGSIATNTTEANGKCRQQQAGTLSNMGCHLPSTAGVSGTMTSRVNGAAGAQTITVPTATTGWLEDTTHIDSITVGDDWNYNIVSTNGTFVHLASDYTSTAGMGQCIIGTPSGQNFSANTTSYMGIEGGQPTTNITTENPDTRRTCRAAFTFQNLTILVTALASTTTVRLRKGSANVNQVVTASATGVFTDSTHTDVITATDQVDHQVATSTGGATTIRVTQMWSSLPVFTLNRTVYVEFEEE